MAQWRRCFSAILILVYASGPTAAHEFWIEGVVSSVDSVSVINLDLNVGQQLVGQSLPFIPEQVVGFRRLDGEPHPIVGQIGAIPAAQVAFDPKKGFAAIIEMAPRKVQHSEWTAFLRYLDMEGLQGVETEHLARGLPLFEFDESYARHAKLVVLGTGKEVLVPEHHSGAPIEIEITTIQENSQYGVSLQGRLLVDGALETNRQVMVFERSVSGVKSYPVLTDTKGEFRTTSPKGATLLFNSVRMTNEGRNGAAWHSDWASLLIVEVAR